MIRAMLILMLGGVIASVDGAAADFTIIQKNKAISVRQIAIKVGDQITFVNNDSVTHNLYSETKGLEFEIELQPPGRSDTVRFSQPGVAEVLCAIHPNIQLQVHVRP
jgi:plastocyanin